MKKVSLLICFLLLVFTVCSCTKKCTHESIDDDGVCVKCGETVEGEGEETDDNTGGEETGGNTGGEETGGNTGGEETGGNTGGEETGGNTGGEETGGNTGGEETGGNTGGEETGGNTGGEETGGNTGGEKDDPDHIHSFTQRIRDPEYLVEDLKCGAKEKYYYSCTCGEKGESTFFTSYTIEHELVDGSCVNCPARQSSEGLDLRKHRPDDPFTFAGVGSFEGEHVVVDLYGNFKVGIIDTAALTFTDKVKSIYIGNDVTEIRMAAFAGCTSLESVHIGSRVRKIALFDDGASAFEGNKNLKSITVDEDNPFFTSIDGNLYTKDGKRLLVYCLGKEETTFTIPDSVTEMEYELFKDCDNLLEINTGNGLKHTHFDGCKNLTTLNVGTGVEALGGLFSLTKLENIHVSEGNAHYKMDEGILYSKDGTRLAYYPRVRTESHFVIPDGITDIGSYAFSGCSNLREVTFCSDVLNVGISSFSNCVSLEVVHLNEGLQYIGDYAFYRCKMLREATFPTTLENIGSEAFAACESITDIKIPDGEITVKKEAFKDCIALERVDLGTGTACISERMFSGCVALLSVQIPSSVTEIMSYAFAGCVSLQKIEIPSTVTFIGQYAFSGCKALTDIVFEDPEGWKRGNQLISSDELSNSATAADYLTDPTVFFPFSKSEEP